MRCSSYFIVAQKALKEEMEGMRHQLDEVLLEYESHGDMATKLEEVQQQLCDLSGNVAFLLHSGRH